MARGKIMGKSESPCLTPRQWRILFPGSPLIKKEEEAVPQRAEIQSLHLDPNPRYDIISMR
jgi:hypothetical protein